MNYSNSKYFVNSYGIYIGLKREFTFVKNT